MGTYEETADACPYLAGAGFVTGQMICVNGGDGLFPGRFTRAFPLYAASH